MAIKLEKVVQTYYEALEEGKISRSRYENYVQIYNELKDKRKY